MTDQRLRLFIAKRIRGLLAGNYRSWLTHPRGHDLDEKRRFRLGDDPRNIDFLATIKEGGEDPKIQIHRIDRGANLIFLIDCSRSMRLETVREKYSFGVELVRQITEACRGSGDRFRLLTFDQKIIYDSGLKVSPHAIEEIIQELLSQKQNKKTDGKTNLTQPLKELIGSTSQFSMNLPSLVFIVSDLLLEDDFSPQLAELNERSDVFAIVIRDPNELNLPKPRFGFARLVDPETGRKIIARAVKDPLLDKIGQILRRSGTDHLVAETNRQPAEILENLIEIFEAKAFQ